MTFSIVALRSHRRIGVAAVTALQSVGKLACHAMLNVGAIASQALLNPYLAYDGLRLLEQGVDPKTALDRVLAGDPDAASRQVGVIDRHGRTAAWSGPKNHRLVGTCFWQRFQYPGQPPGRAASTGAGRADHARYRASRPGRARDAGA